MSKINLYCNETHWGMLEFLPNISLIRFSNCKKGFFAENGVEAKNNRYGLTISNDPFVIFTKQPVLIPNYTDEQIIKMSKKEYDDDTKKIEIGTQFHKELYGNIYEMHCLMEACKKAGYIRDEDGYLGVFICNRMFDFIKNNKVAGMSKRIG
jgi:hypothetical protein